MTKKAFITTMASLLLASGLFSASTFAATPANATQEPQTNKTSAQRVSINSANANTLAELLIGIGPTKAEAIVAWRAQNGRFEKVEQLLDIKGIGTATLNKNKHMITL